jgi:hypothetical protein
MLLLKNMPLTDYWLGGFINGNLSPRLKFETHSILQRRFKRIKLYFKLSSSNLNIIQPRKNRRNF